MKFSNKQRLSFFLLLPAELSLPQAPALAQQHGNTVLSKECISQVQKVAA